MLLLSIVMALTAAWAAAESVVDLAADPPVYGVDCSAPIHWGIDRRKCPYWYDQYKKIFAGCAKLYSQEECDQNENGRMEMSRDQARTQHNYTTMGFKKIKAPKEVWEPLLAFYNKYKSRKVLEKWYRGSTIVNTWDSPTYMVSFENADFPGGKTVKQQIWDGVQPVIEEWIGGHKIEPTSLYGIRIYTGGAILSQHVDRLPLITSCIINVDQDLDEPWPIEVYDHAGKAYNVTMEPGDLVLYESSTVLHGRPFPMKGRHFSNIFVHFKPIIHDELNRIDDEERVRRGEPVSIPRHHSRLRANSAAPPSPRKLTDEDIFRSSASNGHLADVRKLLESNAELINKVDGNQWQALHEAVRGGHLDVVKYLVQSGADLGHKVRNGGSALTLAKEHLPEDHAVVRYLVSVGAPELL